MKKLTYAAIVAAATALVLTPAAAWAQLPIDMTKAPTLDTGGWVWYAQILVLLLALGLSFLVLLGFLRWAPVWASKKAAAAAPSRPEAPSLAPPIARPEPTMVAAQAAAAASADTIGEKTHAVQEGAVPVADAHAADATASGAAATAASSADDVYQKTLDELLAKGVPQKVAEARAKVAAKKAGG